MSDDKEKKERYSRLDAAASVLQEVFRGDSTPLSDSFLRWRVWNSWESIVGAQIASSSLPVGYVRGCLTVWVKSAARLQEMTFVVKPLMEKINTHVGKRWVRQIRFTQDRKSVPAPAESDQSLREFTEK
jgi:hypothetical protein